MDMQVGGAFRLGENNGASGILRRRLLGWRRYGLLVWLVVTVAVAIGSTFLADALFGRRGFLSAASGLAIYAVVAGGGYVVWLRWCRASLIRGWESRGVANPTLVKFEVAESAFEMQSGPTKTSVLWSGVSEIIPSRLHWLYVANGLAYCVPRRFFADQAAERAFVRTSLEYMSVDARNRSGAADAFARSVLTPDQISRDRRSSAAR
jgi:hypothetical protein